MFPVMMVNGRLVGDLDISDIVASHGRISSLFYTPERAETTLIGNQLALDVTNINQLICRNAGVLNIQGLKGGIDGQELVILVASANVLLFNQFAGAAPEDRIVNNQGGVSLVLTRGALYIYRDSRWRMMWQE